MYLGPGGVGLSKFTAHLEAMLGTENHDTFDPNVFYTDDELRKQVPRMAGHFVFTSQERPSGSKQAIRGGGTFARSSARGRVSQVVCLTAF